MSYIPYCARVVNGRCVVRGEVDLYKQLQPLLHLQLVVLVMAVVWMTVLVAVLVVHQPNQPNQLDHQETLLMGNPCTDSKTHSVFSLMVADVEEVCVTHVTCWL